MAQFVTVVPLIRVIRGKDQFTYQTDLNLNIGELVWTPWRNHSVVGVVIATNVEPFPRSKVIADSLGICLPKAYWEFIQWFHSFYYISLASALYAALPDFVHKPRAVAAAPTLSKLRVGIADSGRTAVIQQLVKDLHRRKGATTVLYQRLNEVAAVILGLVKQAVADRSGPLVLICPEETHLLYWQGVLADYHLLVVDAKYPASVRAAWNALLQHQPVIILGTKRLALLPLTEAAQVIVMDPEHTAHKQWKQNPRYHVQRVVEQQDDPIFFSYAPRLEQYASHPLMASLLTERFLPNLVITKPEYGQVLTEAVQDRVATANSVVVWHNRTGLGRSLVCSDCHHWIPNVDLTECPQCHGHHLKLAGFGTAMLKRQLTELFPDRPVIEVIAASLVRPISAEERPIYVGTSAVFDRLPWQQVDLAIATSLDSQLTWPDFRSHEYTLQQLIWLRNHVPTLILQTYAGEHPVIQAVAQPFPASWYQHTLTERSKLHYPPRGEYIRVINTKTTEERIVTDLAAIPTATDWIIDREC